MIIAVCRSELWLLPEQKSLRLLTFRPWLRQPRVEEAPLSEYAGVRTSKMSDDYGNATLVSLVTAGGEDVPLRQFMQEAWDRLNETYPEILAASSCKHLVFERPDPEIGVVTHDLHRSAPHPGGS